MEQRVSWLVGVTKARQTPSSRFTDDASESAARASSCLVLSDQRYKISGINVLTDDASGFPCLGLSELDQQCFSAE